MRFSDYIVYLDESGDTNLTSVQSDYPVFVLSCCIFKKSDYSRLVVPKFTDFKFKWFGHESTILRGYNFRKAVGEFGFLGFDSKRELFMNELNQIIAEIPFTLVSTLVDKTRYRDQYRDPIDTYEIALKFCMERTYMHLQSVNQVNAKTYFIVESRGNKEDQALELAFRRIADDGQSMIRGGMPNFEIKFSDKKTNSIGLQVADLVGTPIGHKYLKPNQTNRAHDVILSKFRKDGNGNHVGWGLKICP